MFLNECARKNLFKSCKNGRTQEAFVVRCRGPDILKNILIFFKRFNKCLNKGIFFLYFVELLLAYYVLVPHHNSVQLQYHSWWSSLCKST